MPSHIAILTGIGEGGAITLTSLRVISAKILNLENNVESITDFLRELNNEVGGLSNEIISELITGYKGWRLTENNFDDTFKDFIEKLMDGNIPDHNHLKSEIRAKSSKIAIPVGYESYELPDMDFADVFTASIEGDTTFLLPDINIGLPYELNIYNFSENEITVVFTSEHVEHIFNATLTLSATSMTHLIIKRFNYYEQWEGVSSEDYTPMLIVINYACMTDPNLPQSMSLSSPVPEICPYFFNPAEYQGSVDFAGRKWITQQAWGLSHSGKPNSHYSNDSVFVDDDGVMHLSVIDQPRKVTVFDTEKKKRVTLNPKWGVGLVTCCDVFSYGVFEFEAKLPRGTKLFPSIWMYDSVEWPPEIDLFEGYTNKFGGYFNILYTKISNGLSNAYKLVFKGKNPSMPRNLFNWCVEANISSQLGGFNSFSNWGIINRFKRPDKDFINYKLVWKKDFIKFIYDGLLIREITDPELLSQFDNRKLRVILNCEITKNFTIKDYMKFKQEFLIKNFKYTSL